MSAQHTPGPWVVSLGSDGFGMHEIESRALPERNSAGDHGRVFAGYCKPEDARLIAAAPELLAALQGLHAALAIALAGKDGKQYANLEARSGHFLHMAPGMAAAEAAIATATGSAS